MTTLRARWHALANGWRRSPPPSAAIWLVGAACATLLAFPAKTVVTKSLDQQFLILVGIQRILEGQIPGIDFQSSLGPLAFYIPALGYQLTGSFGAAMPVAMAVLILAVTIIASHVLVSRLRAFVALLFGTFLLVVLSAPNKLGEPFTALSFGLYQDRVCWVAIALLFIMYVRPARRSVRHTVLDATSAAVLTLTMIYLQVSYGLLAFLFLFFTLTDRWQRGWASGAIVAITGAVLVVEFGWRGSTAYLVQAWTEVQASIAVSDLRQLAERVLAQLPDLLLLSVPAFLLLRRRRSIRDLLFLVLCAAGGLWLIDPNLQRWGVLTIHSGAAAMTERLLRQMDTDPGSRERLVANPAGVSLYFLAFVLPTIIHCATALGLHAGAGLTGAGKTLSLDRVTAVNLADLWTAGEFRSAQDYLAVVGEGEILLRRLNQPIRSLAVVGSVDAFSAALNLRPAEGIVADLRWDFADRKSRLLLPEKLAGSAETVLVRKNNDFADVIAQNYLPHLRSALITVDESDNWILMRRRGGQTASDRQPPE